MDGRRVLPAVKEPTTGTYVMIGTTQFANAFIEGRQAVEVTVLRAALPATQSVRPPIDSPVALSQQIGQQVYLIGGGCEFYGRERAPLDESAVADAAQRSPAGSS